MIQRTFLIPCLTAALLAFGASAADIIVTTTADNGAGSLRQAIAAATSGDTILFDPTLSGQTIPLIDGELLSGELLIDKNLTITGPGATQLTISGNNNSRVFDIVGDVTVTLSGLSLTGGNGQGTKFNNNGGAVNNPEGTLTITRCVLSGNASLNGGAIRNTGNLIVIDSTLSGNSAANSGGAIYAPLGSILIHQSTFFGNHAESGGGAIQALEAVVTHCMIAGNVPDGIQMRDNEVQGSLEIGHTLLADNGENITTIDAPVLLSLGYNLSDDTSTSAVLTESSDLNNTPAGLDPYGLQDNGGPTPTIALYPGSAAIDAGDPNFASPPDFDQRGASFPRVFNERIDIGAFEYQPTPNLALSDQHLTVHYHDKNAPGATADNQGYTHADIRGDVRFIDASRIPADILANHAASQVSVHVKAVLGGQIIANTTLSLGVHDGKREKWESARGLAGPVEALKIHWEGALKFTTKDSNPASPKIESKFIGIDTTDLRYEAQPGTYTTTLPSGVVVTVAGGKITGISGLVPGTFEIAKDGKRADLTLPYRLVPGMVITTVGDLNDAVLVAPGVNYTTVEAKFQLKLRAGGLSAVPLFNATPDLLQYEFTLGTGEGEWPAFATATIGAAATPWDRNADNHKKYKDEETTD